MRLGYSTLQSGVDGSGAEARRRRKSRYQRGEVVRNAWQKGSCPFARRLAAPSTVCRVYPMHLPTSFNLL
jgi:hypothetical protein